MDKPIPDAVAAEAAALLTNWLDADECECEPYGHSCGRPNVIRVRDDLLAIAAAQQQGQADDDIDDDRSCAAGGPAWQEGFSAGMVVGRDEARDELRKPMQQGGGECTKCRGTGEVCTGYIDGTPEMFDCTCPAAAPPSAPVGVEVNGRTPTHCCRVCGALWADFGTHWSLVSASCGKCCDNVPMGEQIAPLALLTATAAEIRAVKRARDFLARSDASEAEGDAFAGGWSECEAYVAQQPAAVALSRKYPDDGNGDDDAYNRGWNECLDALATQHQEPTREP